MSLFVEWFDGLTAILPCFINVSGESGKNNSEISNNTASAIINCDIAKMLIYVPKINANKYPKLAAKIIDDIKKPRI